MSAEQERGEPLREHAEESLREHAEAMEHWGENPNRDPKAHERSEELAARAGLPSEADRRDRWAGVQDEAGPDDASAGDEAASGAR